MGLTASPQVAAYRHALRLSDGVVLNRYWDDRAAPRDESYAEDVDTARHTNRRAEVYRDLRAGAETGWDFSSRWLADGKNLWTIRTTAIAPVDLNALMMHLEATLAKAYRLKGDQDDAKRYQARADERGAAIRRLMWNANGGFFADYLGGTAVKATSCRRRRWLRSFFRSRRRMRPTPWRLSCARRSSNPAASARPWPRPASNGTGRMAGRRCNTWRSKG